MKYEKERLLSRKAVKQVGCKKRYAYIQQFTWYQVAIFKNTFCFGYTGWAQKNPTPNIISYMYINPTG